MGPQGDAIPLDVHLMITDPDKYAPEFIKAGADWVSVHPDTCADPKATLNKIRELGAKSSVAVNPDVPLSQVENCLADIDMILMMTVSSRFRRPGFYPGGASQDRGNEKNHRPAKAAGPRRSRRRD
jgi:ribulose-phosphate 3-epimerase